MSIRSCHSYIQHYYLYNRIDKKNSLNLIHFVQITQMASTTQSRFPPPSAFSHPQHVQRELQARKVLSTTFYGLAWSPDGARYLVACSSFGVICIWDILGSDNETHNPHKNCLSEEYWCDDDEGKVTSKSSPVLK